jgi:ribosome-binding protein aMBF1 (putative translation factor)
MENKNIIDQFDELLTHKNEEEQLEHDAQMLAFQFLTKVDKVMEEKGISKKDLAQKVGTSASFITQMFRGDRKPNWTILARMQRELGLTFKVTTQEEIEELLGDNILDYHRNWTKSRSYARRKGIQDLPEAIMYIEESEQPMAYAG